MLWIVYANLKRRKIRTALTIVGISIGVAALFALLSISAGIRLTLEEEIEGLGAHIVLLPEGCPYMLTISLMQGVDTMEYIAEEMYLRIREMENVALAVPVVVGKARVAEDLVSVYGTTEGIVELKQWDSAGFNGAVIGSDVADDLSLALGQTIQLSSQGEVTQEITKILDKTGGRDDTFIFLPLDQAHTLFGLEGNLSAILVQTEDLGRIAETRYTLGRLADLQAVPPTEMFDTLIGLFASLKANLLLIVGIAIVAGALTTINTMTMAVFERKKDIGLLRSIGATKKEIFKMFILESLLLSLVAGILGALLSYVFLNFFPITQFIGIQYRPHFSVQYVLIALIVACAVGSVAGLYPAWSAASTAPIKALREL
ncbi:MAG TPA: ABC transporter permease [Atribacteraceae bacterium]|nr:ABC transporter permease [Atribacteraceae bacterium]